MSKNESKKGKIPPFPCYQILESVDGIICCQLNRTQEQVDSYLSQCTPADIKYGKVKVLVSIAGSYEAKIETHIHMKLGDDIVQPNGGN